MSFEEFETGWADIFTLNEPVARLIGTLKERGYTLLLGSNTNVLHANFFRRKFKKTIDQFDHLVFSYEIGRIKPDHSFFAACLDLVHVPAGSCIFIDDAPANVEGAESAGLKALLYRNTPAHRRSTRPRGRGPRHRGMTPGRGGPDRGTAPSRLRGAGPTERPRGESR